MMMIPKRNFDLFDGFFNDPFFERDERKLMKTDIKEKKDKYIIDMDLPGYEKENIKISIEEGYLTINATMNSENEENDDEGNFIRQERYTGECSRSFYIGDNITENDIKESFKNGILKLEVPKMDAKKEIPAKKYIQIDD